MTKDFPTPLVALRDRIAALELSTSPEATRDRDAVLKQLDDYILPRLDNLDAPLLAVTGGSTGAGKSTLVNALLREEITTPGVIRPTTRQPILICHPADSAWFNSPRILPGLAREHGAGDPTSTTSIRIVTSTALAPGLALVDAPDFDSVADANRDLSSQLLAAADLWVFVTTPSRYADNVVWTFLRDAASRDLQLIAVLNKTTPGDTSIQEDFRRMLDAARLSDAELLTVERADATPQIGAGANGVAKVSPNVDELRSRLAALSADAAARREVARRTVQGAVAALEPRLRALAEARGEEESTAASISGDVAGYYEAAHNTVLEAASDGNLLRKEVLQRWQDVIGTSDVMRTLEGWFSRTVDKVGSMFSGKPGPAEEVKTEIESGLHAVIVDAAETAAGKSWRTLGDLRDTADPALAQASEDISDEAAAVIRDWQANLVRTIQEEAGSRKQRARLVSLGLNVVTVALMLVVFASTAGITGGEFAIAGGSAVVAQKLLETIFGEDNVRRMAKRAREDLSERIRALMDFEQARYTDALGALMAGTTSAELADAAAAALGDTRIAGEEA